MLCVVDDAQWLDDESADILSFVARRLLADRVGMLFAIRETTEPDPRLQALPGLRIAGLPEQDALRAPRDRRSTDRSTRDVAARIIAETGGNPLAIVEAARELTPEQLGGRAPLPEPLPVGHQLEVLFVRRVRELPPDTQTLLLLAAADQPGQGDRLWRAAAALGIPESAAVPAEAARNGGLLAGGAVLPPARPVGGLPRRAPRSSGGRPTGPSLRPAIRSSTQFPGPGIWRRPPPGPTKRSRPTWRRQPNGPGAVVAMPPRPRSWNARRC